MKKYLFLSMLCIVAISCSKEAGPGGTATIQGKIYVEELNNLGNVNNEYYGPEEDVYIVYGDADFYGDRVRTHYDGTYKFEFLHTGTYKIYAYSDCDCPAETEPIIVDVTITDGGETVVLDDIVINK